MDRIYAAAIVASKVTDRIDIGVVSIALSAANDDEATGIALRECFRRFPKVDGYHNHSASVTVVPDKVILETAKAIEAEGASKP